MTDNKDMVNHPPHYNQGKYETIDIIEDALGEQGIILYCQGNALKYILRMWHKNNPVEDVKKAVWYLNKIIEVSEKQKRESN